jgi:hypothetical protein
MRMTLPAVLAMIGQNEAFIECCKETAIAGYGDSRNASIIIKFKGIKRAFFPTIKRAFMDSIKGRGSVPV